MIGAPSSQTVRCFVFGVLAGTILAQGPNVECIELAFVLWFVVLLLIGYIIGRK
jgi:hypothetical protein